MLLRIRRDPGARALVAVALAGLPLFGFNEPAGAAPNSVPPPAITRAMLARVANPATIVPRTYQPSTRRSPARAAASAPRQPRVSGPGTGPQLVQDPGFEIGRASCRERG